MQQSLRHYLRRAQREQWAVPHFNAADLSQLRGICEAAAHLRTPIMVGMSEGERTFVGLEQAVALVHASRSAYGVPIFLNADHTKSVRAACDAIDAGFDSVHIDLSRRPYRTNLSGTKRVVAYARKKRRDVHVEGELGYLVTESSRVYTKRIVVDPETLTKPDAAVRFVAATGIDRLAPAVGNLHGIAANRPRLNTALIATLRRRIPSRIALVLHGGSGNTPQSFRRAIAAGMNNVHISTALRVANARALRSFLRLHPEELAPYAFAASAAAAVRREAERYIALFGAAHKA